MADKAFRRRSRLLKPADFQRVFKQAVVSSDDYFKVLASAGKTPEPRLGMAVSRKVEARATGRNRIKRVIRESFRNNLLGANAAKTAGCDIVVLARNPASAASNARLSASLESHWRKIDRQLSAERERVAGGDPST